MGTSHVSVNTKIVKATCIAALVHPCLSAMGLTNSVQPYCRFAIIAMQTMPITSCIHRYEAGLVIGLSPAASASLRISSSISDSFGTHGVGPLQQAPPACRRQCQPAFVVRTYLAE